MTRRDLESRARPIIAQALNVLPSRIRDGADFRTDLLASSEQLTMLFKLLGATFGIRISSDEAAFCQTAGTAFDLIENKIELRILCSGERRVAR